MLIAAAFVTFLPSPVFAEGPRDGAPGTAVRADGTVLWERNIGPRTADLPYPYNASFDPIVATHPTDPQRLAVAYHRWTWASRSCSSLISALRITRDGGRTWREAVGYPWAGTGRAPNLHAAIAWGPGPNRGSARLYWADTTMLDCDSSKHLFSVAYSDDEGATWSKMHNELSTPPTGGGYPDITVDRHPASPNYGVVYAVYNWFPNAVTEPGLRLLASADFGRTWKGVEVPPVGGYSEFPFKYRIGYRVRSGPDGSVYVSFSQSDTTDAKGSAYARLGFGISRARFDRANGSFQVREPVMARTVEFNRVAIGGLPAPGSTDTSRLQPRWTHGLDIDPVSGRVFLAIADYRLLAGPDLPRGIVHVGRSSDGGLSWQWSAVPPLPKIGGRHQSAHKPTLVVHGNDVFIGLHGLADVPFETRSDRSPASVGNAFSVSSDAGMTFSNPQPISPARWDLEALARAVNRAGLRDRAELTADGRVIYVYGDGRLADPTSKRTAGRSQIYGALVSFGPN